MFEPVRGGTRGGQAEFKWSDVSADKDREVRSLHSSAFSLMNAVSIPFTLASIPFINVRATNVTACIQNYLGHSINAPTGRWQKNKDIHWYQRDLNGDDDAAKREEIRKIKEQEAEALAAALCVLSHSTRSAC